MLYAGDRPIADHIGIRSESVLSWWFPGYAGLSPGLISLLQTAEAAADAGLDHVELGKGREDYKESFRSTDLAIAEGRVERPSSVAMARRVQRTPPRLPREVIVRHPALRPSAHRAGERPQCLRERTWVLDG
jgi:CelD/BcsL family acetyltransferase involved in cellulose biosynthesis